MLLGPQAHVQGIQTRILWDLQCLRKVVITPMTWLVQVLVRTRGIRLLLPHVQILLTLSQGTEPGISNLAAGGMAADPACLSS